jgi:hypothetical protein
MANRDPIVAIIGSRTWTDLNRVRTYTQRIATKYPGATIISGGCHGPDKAAEETADQHGLGIISLRPVDANPRYYCELVHNDRARYLLGQTALDYIALLLEGDQPSYAAVCKHRNTIIVQSADHVVAFWKPQSRGTMHAINHAHSIRRPVHIIKP